MDQLNNDGANNRILLLFHQKMKWITCVCGEIIDQTDNHNCKKKIENGTLSIRQCDYFSENEDGYSIEERKQCQSCLLAMKKEKYRKRRWRTDFDGYIHCAQCGEKLGCEDICHECFCKECHEEKTEEEWGCSQCIKCTEKKHKQ